METVNAGGNGNSSAKSEKSSPAKAEKAAKSVEVASTEKKAKTNIASKLGALNAAHASAKALANASPNSRVGKIAAYRDANAASVTAAEDAAEAAATAATAQADADAAAADAAEAQAAADAARRGCCRLPQLPLRQLRTILHLADAAADAQPLQAC